MTKSAHMDKKARFTQGSTLKHVLIMTLSATIGLIAIFSVDLLNLFYISLLKNDTLTAAVGFASNILFFLVSICIGSMIAISALVSKAIGQKKFETASQLSTSGTFWLFVCITLFSVIIIPLREPLLQAVGAQGETLVHASRYLLISLLSMPLMGIGMAFSAVLRAEGDAKLSMIVTLGSGLVTAALDPLFIFYFDLGIDGAAYTMFFARLTMVVVGLYGVHCIHKMLIAPTKAFLKQDFKILYKTALPIILTNIATPISNAFMFAIIAPYGNEAIAANSIVARLIPVAFGTMFALSGAIGPILGQNWGAMQLPRVRKTFVEAALLTVVYSVLMWIVLSLLSTHISAAFSATGQTAYFIEYFCIFITWSWLFHSLLFIGNAAFNNLGHPLLATAFNWGKATLGTVPFAYFGAKGWGVEGALMGQAIGAMVFGVMSIFAIVYVFRKLEHKAL